MCISFLTPPKVYAADITVGATTWYAWWDGKYEHAKHDAGIINELVNDTATGPAFLYGPVLSFKFSENFNLTFVFLYGEFDQSDSRHLLSAAFDITAMTNTIYKRRDGDIALNYRVNDYLKVFAGIKYMAYKAKFSSKVINTGNMEEEYIGSKEPVGYGPGLGLNCAFPVIDNLFVLATLSGFYLRGSEEGHLEIIDSVNPLIVGKHLNDKFDYKEYGINSNLSIAYYITNISTIISLGARLQYFKTDCGNIKDLIQSATDLAFPSLFPVSYNGNKINRIYGITLTATYNFSI